jgi:hypothetical protein
LYARLVEITNKSAAGRGQPDTTSALPGALSNSFHTQN